VRIVTGDLVISFKFVELGQFAISTHQIVDQSPNAIPGIGGRRSVLEDAPRSCIGFT